MIMHPVDIAKELSKFKFFTDFPEASILAFATMSESVEYKQGDLILQQGAANDSLYFLRSGIIAISVDSEIISEISNRGEVFGEMSVINRSPASTTIRAVNTVQVFKINEQHLMTLPGSERFKFQELLYRVYAKVLVERLTKTNDKAKRFEIANRELSAAQIQLKQLNENLEAEIVRRSSELVKKVHDMTENILNPAHLRLAQLLQTDVTSLPIEEAKKLNLTLTEILDFIKPVLQLSDEDQSDSAVFAPKRVLIHDANKKQLNIAKLALAGTGVQLAASSTSAELTESLNSGDFQAILCDAELVEDVRLIQRSKPNVPLVMIVNMDMKFYLETMKYNPNQNFFVSRNAEDRSFTVKNISTTVAKLLRKDFFGMEKYLSWGSKIVEAKIDSSDERIVQSEKMLEHFSSFGVRSAVTEKIQTVSEELLMNAVYDAPTDSSGKPLFNHLPRTEKVFLSRGQEATLKYGIDGMNVAVSVTDPFGSLTKEIIMKYLESCYDGQAGIYNDKKGGAGRGLHMIIESSNLTIFNVIPGKRTEVICLFNLERKEEEVSPTFHLFFAAS